MDNKQVIAPAEMVEKIQAAIEARRSSDFLIIARTDARAMEGIESALRRARLYREAGADILFVEAPQSEQEVAAGCAANSPMSRCCSISRKAARLRRLHWSGCGSSAIGSSSFPSRRCSRPLPLSEKQAAEIKARGLRPPCSPELHLLHRV